MSWSVDSTVLMAMGVCIAAALSTVLGSLSVLVTKQPSPRLLAFGLAFAGGAMVYISLVEIFWKAEAGFAGGVTARTAYVYATLAFFSGVLMLAMIDRLIPNPHALMSSAATDSHHIRRVGVLAALAITAHNLPEGLATFLATLDNPAVGISLAAAIAVHNIPEGVSIAIPIYYATGSRRTAIVATCLSALAEPVGALIGYLLLAPFLTPAVFAWVFGAIAGAMVFLALDELLPTAKRYAQGHETVYGMVIGMAAIAVSLMLFK
ncbi:zinc transporter ZupT [Aestuariivirga sp.]|jgi:ZIP family zinc transporter|uniref:zinc transporter ZupT n=1 Tax=Aestuariivirga sp. TaxID=2650926 RepID=UPI00378460B5